MGYSYCIRHKLGTSCGLGGSKKKEFERTTAQPADGIPHSM